MILALVVAALLGITPLVMLALRLTRPGFAHQWLLAAGVVGLSWPLMLLARPEEPVRFGLGIWRIAPLFPFGPALLLDKISWTYGLAVVTLAMAVILTAVARLQHVDWRSWAATLLLAMLSLLAVLAENPLTTLLAWMALDWVELLSVYSQERASAPRERAAIAFSTRIAGSMALLMGWVLLGKAGQGLTWLTLPPELSIYVLMAAGLRLGVLPLQPPVLAYLPIRRGLGTSLRLLPAASCLALLTRTSAFGLPDALRLALPGQLGLIVLALAGLYGGLAWMNARDALDGRAFWIFGCASLALAASAQQQPAASLAWGLTCLLTGAALFLYAPRSPQLMLVGLVGALWLSGVPLTPNWAGTWLFASPSGLSGPLWLLLDAAWMLTHGFLLLGYLRHAILPEASPDGMERWVWLIYPAGLAWLLLSHLILSLSAWPGTQDVPWLAWGEGLLMLALVAGVWAWRQRSTAGLPGSERLAQAVSTVQAGTAFGASFMERLLSLTWFYDLIWRFYHLSGRVFRNISGVLEGEAGVLWTLVLLLFLLSLAQTIVGGG